MLLKPKPNTSHYVTQAKESFAISNFTHASLIPHSKPVPAQEYQRTPPNALTAKEATTHNPQPQSN